MLVTDAIFVIFDMLLNKEHPLKALAPILDNEVVKIKSIPVNEETTPAKAEAAIEVTENNNVAVEIPTLVYDTFVITVFVFGSEYVYWKLLLATAAL